MNIRTLICLLLTSVCLSTPANAETVNCTPITSLPALIQSQGLYCLTGHLFTDMEEGNAIEIAVNSVTIDMNGYKLGGLGAGTATRANGIYAADRKNLVIRNGNVRGFYRGIFFDGNPDTGSRGHVVEDVLLDNNTFIGIQMVGRGNTIRRNQIVDTGGSTSNAFANGIYFTGPGGQIEGNRVATVISREGGGGSAAGIIVTSGSDLIIQNNSISRVSGDDAGNGTGVRIIGATAVAVRANNITSADIGVSFESASGVYKDNLTDNIAQTRYSGGTDGGGNY